MVYSHSNAFDVQFHSEPTATAVQRTWKVEWDAGPRGCGEGTFSVQEHAGAQLLKEVADTCTACPNTEACLTGNICAAGYRGPFCAGCSMGYYKLHYNCNRCPDDDSLLLFVSIVLFIGYAVSMLRLSIQKENVSTAAASILLTHMQFSFRMLQSISGERKKNTAFPCAPAAVLPRLMPLVAVLQCTGRRSSPSRSSGSPPSCVAAASL